MELRFLTQAQINKPVKDEAILLACTRAMAALSMSKKKTLTPPPITIEVFHIFIKNLKICFKNTNDTHTLICLCLLYLDVQQFKFIPVEWFSPLDMIQRKFNTLTEYEDMITWSNSGSRETQHERETLLTWLLYRLSTSTNFGEIIGKDDYIFLIKHMLTISSIRSTIGESPTPYEIMNKLTFVAFYRSWKDREQVQHNMRKKTNHPHHCRPIFTMAAMSLTESVIKMKVRHTDTADEIFWKRAAPFSDSSPTLAIK